MSIFFISGLKNLLALRSFVLFCTPFLGSDPKSTVWFRLFTAVVCAGKVSAVQQSFVCRAHLIGTIEQYIQPIYRTTWHDQAKADPNKSLCVTLVTEEIVCAFTPLIFQIKSSIWEISISLFKKSTKLQKKKTFKMAITQHSSYGHLLRN